VFGEAIKKIDSPSNIFAHHHQDLTLGGAANIVSNRLAPSSGDLLNTCSALGFKLGSLRSIPLVDAALTEACNPSFSADKFSSSLNWFWFNFFRS
jgi:hypothetical protein